MPWLKDLWELRRLPRFLYLKHWKYRHTIGKLMRWDLDTQTQQELLLNGWYDKLTKTSKVVVTDSQGRAVVAELPEDTAAKVSMDQRMTRQRANRQALHVLLAGLLLGFLLGVAVCWICWAQFS